MKPIELHRGNESDRPKETLFPLDSEVLRERMDLLADSSEDFLRMAIEARGKWGPADSLYANMPTTDLIMWHDNEGDFTLEASLYYKAGLLYGMDVAKISRVQNDPFTDKLKANDYDAFAKTLVYLQSTYADIVGMDDLISRQRIREKRFTGSNVLAEAAERKHGILSNKEGMSSADADNDARALYTGMVDGVIFVDAYSAFSHGSEPQTFAADS